MLIALTFHASKVMLKILQTRLQQYVNQELPDVQVRFRKSRGTRCQIVNVYWLMEKAKEFQKINSASLISSSNFLTDVQNRLLDSVGEGEGGMFRENSTETSILSRVKQITSSGWMHETGAQGWCTGKTQRDGMEREEGEGIWMGNTCISKADSCQCMEKTITIL